MSVFADSSALVKLYVPEQGHRLVRSLPTPFVVSTMARVEVPAAFWGKVRAGELSSSDASLLARAFEFDYHGDATAPSLFVIVSVHSSVLEDGARLAARHGLRALDAVQLACAGAARAADPSVDTVAAFDHRLADAARAEGFIVVDAQ